jgi:Uma2 family endonuclease
MSDLIELDEKISADEVEKMPSRNHSLIVGRITGLLFNDKRFTVMPELSLDTSPIELKQFNLHTKDELIPNISIYQKTIDLSEPLDELKMTDMPALAIEVLSPRQGMNDIIAKFQAYFALGIKSCWLVMPAIKSITVYSQPNQHKTFDINDDEVIDEMMDIHLFIRQIFGKSHDNQPNH